MATFLKKYFLTTFLLADFVLLYFQLFTWQSTFLGWVAFLGYLWLVGGVWQHILRTVFGMKQRDWVTRLFAWFAVFVLLGLGNSVTAVWYTMTDASIFGVYVLVALVSIGVKKWIHTDKRFKIHIPSFKVKKVRQAIYLQRQLALVLYAVLWLAAVVLMSKSGSIEALQSPWQTLHPWVLPLMFITSLLVGYFLFSKFGIKTILAILIAHSFLLHLYLPLSHQLPWGGDVWRHIGVEQMLLEERIHPPVLFGPEAKWREVLGADVPEALVIPNKYTYGHLWGSTVMLAKTLDTSLLAINKWLLPIVWSLLMPLLLFRIGGILFQSWRRGLLLSGLSFIAFPLQALGALTLPVSLGHLTFFLVFMLWLQYLRDRQVWQRRVVFFLSAFMIFGYSLHFVLMWVVILLSFVLQWIGVEKGKRRIERPLYRKIAFAVLAFVSIFIFPLIELFTKISFMPNTWTPLSALKQLLGQWSGWFFASAIRSHDILSGNIFFNHTPEAAFVSNIFTDVRWQVMAVMFLLGFGVLYALFTLHKAKPTLAWRVIAYLFATLFGGYVIGWYVLDGDRLFVRRMDAVLAVVILIVFVWGITALLQNKKIRFPHALKQCGIPFFILLFSWFATTSYASGPDMRVVSTSEHQSAAYVWENGTKESPYCVLADTWTLLALEALSGRAIVGGGFPIGYQFAQPERVVLHGEFQRWPRIGVITLSQTLTQSDQCWFVVAKSELNSEKEAFLRDLFTGEPEILPDHLIWSSDMLQEETKKDGDKEA